MSEPAGRSERSGRPGILRSAVIVGVVTVGLSGAAAALLAAQVLTSGEHPVLAGPAWWSLRPWVVAAIVLNLPLAASLALFAGLMRRPATGAMVALLALFAVFHGLRETAEARGIEDESLLQPYPTRLEMLSAVQQAAADHRPDVVLITIDTLRWDHLGYAGAVRPVSPRIDALAQRGSWFVHAVAQAPETRSSMASMMVGLHPHVIEIDRGQRGGGAWVSSGFHLLAERLRAAGYDTAGFVSNAYLKASNGFGQGFTTYDESSVFGFEGAARRRNAADVVDVALAWLETREGDAPRFVWLHLLDPHHPYEPAEAGPWEQIESEEFIALAATYDALSVHAMTERFRDLAAGRRALEEGELDYLIGRYDAEIRFVDRQIGRFLSAFDRSLESRGQTLADVLIVLTADHGEEFFDHGGMLHSHTLYDELVRVPMVIAGPGFDDGGRIDGQARLLDVAPTILKAASVPFDDLAGRDLQSVVAGTAEGSVPALSFLSLRQAALRTPEHKIIAGYGQDSFFCSSGDRLTDIQTLFAARYGARAAPDHAASGGASHPPEVFELRRDPREQTPSVGEPLLESLRCQLAQQLHDHPPRAVEAIGSDAGLDSETRSELRALGYVD